MTTQNYLRISGLVFVLVAFAHAYRAILALPLVVGTAQLPVWFSWLGALGAGFLAVWAFRSKA
ncbi:MAG: hypothetical protein ABJC13_05175 [Acidobacteriota bacterium]